MASGTAGFVDCSRGPARTLHDRWPRRVAVRLASAALVVMISVLALCAVGLDGRSARADDVPPVVPDWYVAELNGAAFSRGTAAGGGWQALQTGARLAPGSIVKTGENTRLVLANGVDRVSMSASSEIELPAASEEGAVTRVIHWLGSVFFEVGKRPPRQFEVDTPFLVAIVKGTKFTTTVADIGASVKVSEGIVGVSPAKGGEAIDVTAGQAASVSAAASDRVSRGELSSADAPAPSGAATNANDAAPAAGGTADGSATDDGNQNGNSDGNEQGRGDDSGGYGDTHGDGDGDGFGHDHGDGRGHGCGHKGPCGGGLGHGHPGHGYGYGYQHAVHVIGLPPVPELPRGQGTDDRRAV